MVPRFHVRENPHTLAYNPARWKSRLSLLKTIFTMQ
jgi:hypothetical protein